MNILSKYFTLFVCLTMPIHTCLKVTLPRNLPVPRKVLPLAQHSFDVTEARGSTELFCC